MTVDDLSSKAASLRRRAVTVSREHWGYVLVGTLLAIVLTIGVYALVLTLLKRRRRTYFERVLDLIDELGERREQIAANLKQFVAEKADASGVSKTLDKGLKAIRRELAAVEQSLKNVSK